MGSSSIRSTGSVPRWRALLAGTRFRRAAFTDTGNRITQSAPQGAADRDEGGGAMGVLVRAAGFCTGALARPRQPQERKQTQENDRRRVENVVRRKHIGLGVDDAVDRQEC